MSLNTIEEEVLHACSLIDYNDKYKYVTFSWADWSRRFSEW
jgi:hypothetical protein